MINIREPWVDQRDLRDTGFRRSATDRFTFFNSRGERYVNVSKSRLPRLPEDVRARAVVVMRTRPNNYPATMEGAAVRAVLANLRAATFPFVAGRVEQWAHGDPVGFVVRAVLDRGALLNVLVPESTSR